MNIKREEVKKIEKPVVTAGELDFGIVFTVVDDDRVFMVLDGEDYVCLTDNSFVSEYDTDGESRFEMKERIVDKVYPKHTLVLGAPEEPDRYKLH